MSESRRIGFPLVSAAPVARAWPRPTTINPGGHARAQGRVVISSQPGTSAEGIRVEIRARL